MPLTTRPKVILEENILQLLALAKIQANIDKMLNSKLRKVTAINACNTAEPICVNTGT